MELEPVAVEVAAPPVPVPAFPKLPSRPFPMPWPLVTGALAVACSRVHWHVSGECWIRKSGGRLRLGRFANVCCRGHVVVVDGREWVLSVVKRVSKKSRASTTRARTRCDFPYITEIQGGSEYACQSLDLLRQLAKMLTNTDPS